VATWSKAWVCSCLFAGTAGSKPAAGYACLSLVSVVPCQLEVSVMGRSLTQRSPTVCACVRACVCVCVCARARARARDRQKERAHLQQ
jgi:hypothetical protein